MSFYQLGGTLQAISEIGPLTQYRLDKMSAVWDAGPLLSCKAKRIINTSYYQATKYARIRWFTQDPSLLLTNNIAFITNKDTETLTHAPNLWKISLK